MEKRTEEMYIGRKTTMTYVMAALQSVNDGAATIILKARGKLIAKAVDVAEVLRHRFLTGAKIADIVIDTEKLTNEDKVTRNVSSIEITLEVPE